MEKVIRFRLVEVQPQDFAQLLLIFCQFEPGIAYKSAAYVTKRVQVKNLPGEIGLLM